MLSFYDWYADLPVASPQVFGDQTDVPESGDWWDATYLMLWGSNVPVTRTPDAHWMTEARYRGQKVVVCSPDYSDATKFADEWLAPSPGTDGALAMAMGHVAAPRVLRRPAPRPTSTPTSSGSPTCRSWSGWTSAPTVRTCPASSSPRTISGRDDEHAAFKTVLLDSATGEAGRAERHARRPVRPARRGPVEPRPGRRRPAPHAVRRRQRERPGRAAPLRLPRRRRDASSSAACRPGGSRAGSSPPSTTCCSPATASAGTACPASGPPATTTRRHPPPRPGRRRSPASPRTRPSGSAGSSRRTPSTRRAGP